MFGTVYLEEKNEKLRIIRQNDLKKVTCEQATVELDEAGIRRCSVIAKKRKLTAEALHELKRTMAEGKGRQGVRESSSCVFATHPAANLHAGWANGEEEDAVVD